jgi:prevent-host-death family protein
MEVIMEQVISATEARIHFGELMRRAIDARETIIVEKGGKPQVVILSIEQYTQLKALHETEPSWQEQVRQAREQIIAELGDRTLPPPEEIIRQMREERTVDMMEAINEFHHMR